MIERRLRINDSFAREIPQSVYFVTFLLSKSKDNDTEKYGPYTCARNCH
jgi:hypothetical protein